MLLLFVFIAIVIMPATSNALNPTAVATTTNVTIAGGTSYSFTVRYVDDGEIDVITLDSNDVRVTGPGGFSVGATFVSVNIHTNGTPRIATYRIVPPGGSWNSIDNGTYNVVMQGLGLRWHGQCRRARQYRQFYGDDAPIYTHTSSPAEDFNGDGKPDYALFHSSDRKTALWYLAGTVLASSAYGPTLPAGWVLADTGDFNGNAKNDYVIFNPSTRQTAIWFLVNATFTSGTLGPTLPAGWTLAAVANFNPPNNKLDYLLFNPATRQTAIWYLNGTSFVSSSVGPTLPSGWSLAGVADFNGNNRPDYVLFQAATGKTAVWFLSGGTLVGSAYGPIVPSGWAIAGVADFNLNGKPDYVLFRASTRQTAIWYLNGTVFVSSAVGPTLPSGWELISP